MIEIHITEDHIYHQRWTTSHRPDCTPKKAIFAAFQDAGIEIEVEIHINQIPPNHDWGLLVIEREIEYTPTGTVRLIRRQRYAMSHALIDYVDDLRIHNGKRTKPAVITLDDKNMTADVRVKRYVSYARQLGYKKITMGGHWE